MRAWWALVGLAAAGCIKPQLQPCGDLLCPADSVCLPDQTCASQESIDQCTGKADGETCTTSLFTGSCANGVCRSPRCGDGIVSGSEQCDGAVAGVDCVTYGFDTGVPTCSDRCGLDVVGSCVRFGWDRVVDVPVIEVYVDGGRIAVITEDRHHLQLYEGSQLVQDVDVSSAEFVYGLTGNGSTVTASIDGFVLRSVGGGAFEQIDTHSLYDGRPEVVVGDDGTLYLGIFDNGTKVYRSRPGGGWDTILDTSTPADNLYYTGGTLFIVYDTGQIDSYTGSATTWTGFDTASEPISSIVAKPGGGFLYSVYGDHTYQVVNSTVTQFSEYGYDTVCTVGQDVFIGGETTFVHRHLGNFFDEVDMPIFGFLACDSTGLYVAGNGVYHFTGTAFANREGLASQANDAKLLGDGRPVLTTDRVWHLAYMFYWDSPAFASLPHAAAGASETDFYIAEMDGIEHSNGTTSSFITLPPGVDTAGDLEWEAAASRLWAVGASGLAMHRDGTTWTLVTGIPATCDLTRVVVHDSEVYAAGTCGTEGAIWQLGATTATEIKRTSSPLTSLAIDASANLYAAGPTSGVMRIAGAWRDEPEARGVSISATGPNDIWVGGGPKELNHFDGTLWSRVRIVGAAKPHIVATPRAVYIAGASSSVLVR